MPILPDWAVQVLQVLTILALAPLISGIIARVEAILQQRKGPRVLQPYYDIFKLLGKGTVIFAGEHPAAAILSYAHEHGFDLIVCGHHYSRRVGRLLLKGVTQDLVSAAATPVLVVGESHT